MSKHFRERTKTVLYNQRFSPKRQEIHIYFGVRKSFLSQETVHMEDNQFGAAFLLLLCVFIIYKTEVKVLRKY